MNIDPQILSRVHTWLNSSIDEELKDEVKRLMEEDPAELTDAFYRDLEFGTGGLRGIMGAGTNRMNKATVAMATQGLANYIRLAFADEATPSVAIAYDSRNNSAYFAEIAASVLSANGIRVYLASELRPTPWLSFAVRELKCHSGIVITASHNPKEYNGYKVYWNDGGQLVPPHDGNVITEVRKITSLEKVNFQQQDDKIIHISSEIDNVYLERVKALSLAPDLVRKHSDLRIVYTSLHGTGITMVPKALALYGFRNVSILEEQAVPDGNFPTLKSPNPEEPSALQMAIAKANTIQADLVMATDPDADRVGIAVRDARGEFVLLNGNQTAAILIAYLLKSWKDKGLLKGREFIVKTIVTTELLKTMADTYDVDCPDVLTGFKYIAEIIRENEGIKTFIGGGEESYGYLVGDFVRDKDAVISCCLIAEACAWAREQGMSAFEMLLGIYETFGFYYESLLSITKKGKSGAEEIKAMMQQYRQHPPAEIAGSQVVCVKDYKSGVVKDLRSGEETRINLPASDVLQFLLEDETLITVRPSGTEPKIKFYFGLKAPLGQRDAYETTVEKMNERLQQIIAALELQ